ncbi:MAG: TRAP transporter substrate-binding protein [Clostridiales Family XIII bacterium]|nr:TRAP transporter substrate-binding protein [Clostridiales Family XIII bacterium]
MEKRMEGRLKFLPVLLLILAMIFATAACGGPATEPEGDAEAETETGTEAEAETSADDLPDFEFSLSLHDPDTSNNGKFMQAWADEINAKTDGHVTITLFPSSALATAQDVGDMVETGGVDIGWIYTAYYKGQFPLTDVTTVPMIGFGNAVSTTETLWDLYEKYDEMQAEWKNYKLLNLYGNPGMLFASNKSPIDSADDLAGRTMRLPAGPITEYVTALKASPVTMAPPELYEALEKNNIDSYVFEPAGITNFNLQEVTEYFTDLPMYNGAFGLVMNWDKWNALPDEYKAIFEETTQRAGSMKAANDFEAAATASREIIAAAGCEWVAVSDENKAGFQDAAADIIAAWPASIAIDGFDAKAFLDDAIATLKGYSE